MEEKVFFQLNPVEFGSVFPYINDGLYPYRYALDINTVLCDWQNENYMSTARWVVRVVSGGYEVEDKKEGGKKVYRTGEALQWLLPHALNLCCASRFSGSQQLTTVGSLFSLTKIFLEYLCINIKFKEKILLKNYVS